MYQVSALKVPCRALELLLLLLLLRWWRHCVGSVERDQGREWIRLRELFRPGTEQLHSSEHRSNDVGRALEVPEKEQL